MIDILWIGSERTEFAATIKAIDCAGQLRRIASLEEARHAAPPALAILALARPGELAESQVAELRTDWMGTQFAFVLGAWCCGQKRVCKEFSVVPTFYAHESPADRILSLVGSPVEIHASVPRTVPGLVAIYSSLGGYREALADMLALVGMKTVQAEISRAPRTRGVDVVVWHASAEFERLMEELQTIFHRHPGARVLALLTYPREFESKRLISQGVRVIAQPFEFADLCEAIQPPASRSIGSAA